MNDRRDKFAPLIIVLGIALALWPLCFCDFTTWDDNYTVARNPTLNPPTLHSIKVWWTQPVLDMWDPFTYMVNGALATVASVAPDPATGFRLNPYIFHSANVFLHIGSALLVFQILRQLGFSAPSACAAALLFGLHPVQVEPVGWLSGLKDVLYAFLSLAAIQQYLIPGRARYLLATVLFVLATCSKPTAVIVPLIALIIVIYHRRRIDFRVCWQLGLWVILSVPCIVMTRLVQPASDTERIALWKRPFIALDALAFYLYKLVWPASLGVDYGRNPRYVISHGWVYWTWLLPAAIAVALWLARAKARPAIVGAAVFVTGLLPVLGLLPFDFQHYSTVTDHYLYLPMFGVAICAAWTLDQVQDRSAKSARISQRQDRSTLVRLSVIFVLFAFGVRSWFQTWHWRESRALFTNALQVNPACAPACNSLAADYLVSGDLATAQQYAQKAVELAPTEREGRFTLAAVFADEGRLDIAVTMYRQLYQENPQSAFAANELAGVVAQQGNLEEGILLARRAIALNPNLAAAHLNLGSMMSHQRNYRAAIEEYQLALQSDPLSIRAHLNLGAVYLATGEREEALRHYQAALDLDPGSEAARRGLLRLNRGS